MEKPLAHKVRPHDLKNIVGQHHLLGEDSVLSSLIANETIPSMIFFGPPGTGKTTTAIAIAEALGRPYRLFNAVTDNKKKLDQLFVEAEMSRGLVVIVDEVHRLNKDKQDILLPHIESGLITMIGATTANPYFSINPAIRSRVHLFEFLPLTQDDLIDILHRASESIKPKTVEDEVIRSLALSANGDARYALNALDILAKSTQDNQLNMNHLSRLSLSMNITMDKDGDNYYDALSAFQKSIRGSDVNAALYYLAKLVQVGDFDSIERRLITIAYEDIGLANPALCARVVSAIEGARKIGFPEARIPLSAVVIECALSPKSKSAEAGIDAALQVVKNTAHQVPKYLRLNAVGVDDEDMYDYSRSDLWHKIQYLPDEIRNDVYYVPQNMNSAEKTYASNDEALKKYRRSNNLRALKAQKK
ncbi:replication-associated recombination protein A [Erysipelothrix sp. HDW6A]|uniref:replication-associated recombination protein A n=1 Tax=Erysipelothrix sp. HDW6A TaxID=2714928 RepID=UPI00140E0615|nr:replication-associated recombination protein A [Erysipelothrix sp. HDW6A]QIK56541.1 replication-associated recombination protein A [Erysipelothrix sp. HDW6A]